MSCFCYLGGAITLLSKKGGKDISGDLWIKRVGQLVVRGKLRIGMLKIAPRHCHITLSFPNW